MDLKKKIQELRAAAEKIPLKEREGRAAAERRLVQADEKEKRRNS
jgi:hypothetical protein